MSTNCDDLPLLPYSDDKVFAAAQCFVEAKRLLDGLTRAKGGSLIAAQIGQQMRYDATHPYSFAYDFLPFFRTERHKFSDTPPAPYKCLVPTSLVIGESWRWRPDSLTDEEKSKVVRIAYERCAESDPLRPASDCAQYTYVKPLGIVLAAEGKNRVALFAHLNMTHIPAVVMESTYPEPSRLKLFMLDGVCLAVLDDRFVEKVGAPYLIHNLLQAYGVAIENKWPSSYPDCARVIEQFSRLRHRHDTQNRSVDLQDVADDIAVEETFVQASILDVVDIQIPPPKTFAKVAALMAACAIAVKFTGKWPDIQMLLAATAGTMYILLFLPFLPVLRCPVKYLKGNNRWSKRFEIKRQLRREREQRSSDSSVLIGN